MRSQARYRWLALIALFLTSTGCCCVQGMPGQCGCGSCGLGPLGGYRACASGCGETYVDEWVSEPPCVDQCCAGDVRPVRSLLRALWGSRFVQGCDMCATGCDSCGDSCGGSCGYASSGGSGCSSCGGGGGGSCSSCGGGATVTEPLIPSTSHHVPTTHHHTSHAGEAQMVPGSYKMSAPRRVPASVASERINPARQKMDAKRASYSN